MIKHHSGPTDAQPLSHLLEKLGTPQARGTPYAKTSQDHNLGPFLTLTQPPSAPAALSRSDARGHRVRGNSLALYALLRHFDAKERSFRHTWWGVQWEKARFVVYLIHWQLRKLKNEDWFQGIAAQRRQVSDWVRLLLRRQLINLT